MLINVVDNGPAEQPASPLVQILLLRIRRFLGLSGACQVSFAQYNSKRNFAERIHSQENVVLSRHGPFSSSIVHDNVQAPSKEHRENMEAMAQEVQECIKEAQFGGSNISAIRGVMNEEYIFDDELEVKQFLSLSEGKKHSSAAKYSLRKIPLLYELERIWGITSSFEGTYSEDYCLMSDPETTWKDKYTFFNVKGKSESSLFPLQPVPDYLRWLHTGELHYLQLEQQKRLANGPWNHTPAVFLPSEILQMVYEIFPDAGNSTLEAVSFLSWLPISEVKEHFSQLKLQSEEEIKKDVLREKIKGTDIYKKSKAELIKQCRELSLNCAGTKLDLAERIVVSQNIDISTEVTSLYDGDLLALPISSSQVRKLNMAKLRAILRYHNIPSSGNKDQLVLNVCLLRAGRKHLINHDERSRLSELINTVEVLIAHQISMNEIIRTPNYRKRKNATPLSSEISSKNPRMMASIAPAFSNSCLNVPTDMNMFNIADMLKSLKDDIRILQRSKGNNHDAERTSSGSSSITTFIPKEPYEEYFEIGTKVSVKWTSQDIGDTGRKPGWYTAEVQDSSIDNDWIKIEYSSEPGRLYKLDVTSHLAKGQIKMKQALF